ncbi:MAG TPA: hypothetical protein EYP02_03585 [Sulfurovum sp.]|nr:hypothetical protein [Sulfurovum sp.]
MKVTNYRLQTEIEQLSTSNQKNWFEDYLKSLLESDKPYYQKSDYIALCFFELDNKVNYLSSEIKALTAQKKKLEEAKRLGLEITAKTLKSYGIDKMEGTAISSLTITPSKKKINRKINIKDPNKVMELGFVEFSVDKKSIELALDSEEDNTELLQYLELSTTTETTEAKIKINKRRSVNHTENIELLDDVS